MSKVKRKNHTSDFKAKVVLEAIRRIQTVNEIGQERGVHPTQVGIWKKSLQEQVSTLFEGKRGPKHADARNRNFFIECMCEFTSLSFSGYNSHENNSRVTFKTATFNYDLIL